MRRILLATILVFAACTPVTDGATSTTVRTASSSTTTAAVADGGEDPVCLRGDRPFVTSGNAGTAVRSDSDAARLGSVRWESHPGCERVVIGFTTEAGAPSVDPPSMASAFVREAGVVRVSLGGEITDTGVDEQLVDGNLVDRVFVVRGLDGDRFVDVHLRAPAFSRVTAAGGPGRIVVDVRPGGPQYAVQPIRDGDLVLVEYPPAETSYPFSVSGYTAGSGPDGVGADLHDASTSNALEARVAAGPAGWRAFVLLVPDGPTGPVTLTLEDRIDLSLTAGP